ncbi:MAG: hypothetical protein K8R44_04590 [Sulfurimonas sp.]|nr:hypothetical protein [Sulfurimonas sp.]
MTLEYIESLEATTELEREIKEIIINNVESYDNPRDFFNDILEHGCISGMINELCWYNQTTDFCTRHAEDINSAMYEILEMTGVDSAKDLLTGFDETDFLIIGNHNQNLICWFIFESSCESILRSYEDEMEVA